MIIYEWRQEPDAAERAEITELVELAADYDEEAGFSRVQPPGTGGGRDADVRHLLVRAAPDHRFYRIEVPSLIAYLRLEISDGVGLVQLTVHPDMRSLGVATLLMERLAGESAPGKGWAGTGVSAIRAWAHGHHPAAQRMARRFGADERKHVWKVIRRHLADDHTLESVPAPAGLSFRPMRPGVDEAAIGRVAATAGVANGSAPLSDADETRVMVDENGVLLAAVGLGTDGRVGTIQPMIDPVVRDRGVGRALLADGLAALRKAGCDQAVMYFDSRDDLLVRVSRLLDFQHDQSDVCYELRL